MGSRGWWRAVDGRLVCKRGHVIAGEQDWVVQQGRRRCRACKNYRQRAYSRCARVESRCEWCGESFLHSPRDPQRACSHACAGMLRRARWPSSRIWVRSCGDCQALFVARRVNVHYCSPRCARRSYQRVTSQRTGRDYQRWKRNKRRTATRDSDFTPAMEAQLRRRTRKCRLCGTWMTGRPLLPNSKELDHIIPIGVGGTHTWGNVRIICRDCNLRRPKDGRDFAGQLDLFAQAPGVVVKPVPPRKATVAKRRRGTWPCAVCGEEAAWRPGVRCQDCCAQLGRDAAALRAQGYSWADVAAELDYPHIGNLCALVGKVA